MVIKNWTDGDYVTAADMDELSRSVVMRFTSAANRDAVLVGDLAPQDGMVVYLTDINRHMMREGSWWLPMPGTFIFNAKQSTAQTLTTGVAAAMTWQTVDAPFGGWSGAAPTRLTLPFPGIYTLTSTVAYGSNGAGYRQTSWYQGGSVIANSTVQQPANSASFSTIIAGRTTVVSVAGQVYVEVFALQNSGGDLATTVGASGSSATVVYAGPQ